MTQTTKSIRFSDARKGESRWTRHFEGRPGARFYIVTQEQFDEDDVCSPGFFIEGPVALMEAWDRGLRQARAVPRHVSSAEAGRLAVEYIERELDAVAPRGT